MTGDALLISIKPEYAENIFNGSKLVELRRTRPNISEGDLVFVYVTSPIKCLMGAFEAEKVIEGTPEVLWEIVNEKAGISEDEYWNYFSGADIGFGITIKKAWRLIEPIQLENLREIFPNFHPPQIYRYFSADEVTYITKIITQ